MLPMDRLGLPYLNVVFGSLFLGFRYRVGVVGKTFRMRLGSQETHNGGPSK